jgi:cytochrome c oxidase subunit IV
MEYETTDERPSMSSYYGLFFVIAVLMIVTVAISFTGLPGNTRLILNLLIAGAQAALLSLFFMHLRKSDPVTMLVAAAGLFWLFLLFVLILTDYVTRHYAAY